MAVRIPRKQSATHEQFVAAMDGIEAIMSRDQYERLKAATAERIKKVARGRTAFAWSGGKDSIALEVVCRAAGVDDCCLAMTNLEYRAFLQWVTDHMPEGLTVLNNGWDLDWLAAHTGMLFPKDSSIASKWFAGVQRWGQAEYVKSRKLDCLIIGSRRADGNFVGGAGEDNYLLGELLRFSPLADWRHEDVLACLHYEGLAGDLPPFYRWPRGYRCGTHSWPARQWCESEQQGWSELWTIDQSIVKAAARKIDSAKRFLDGVL